MIPNVPVVLKTGFSDVSKVQDFVSHFFTPKEDKLKNVLW